MILVKSRLMQLSFLCSNPQSWNISSWAGSVEDFTADEFFSKYNPFHVRAVLTIFKSDISKTQIIW